MPTSPQRGFLGVAPLLPRRLVTIVLGLLWTSTVWAQAAQGEAPCYKSSLIYWGPDGLPTFLPADDTRCGGTAAGTLAKDAVPSGAICDLSDTCERDGAAVGKWQCHNGAWRFPWPVPWCPRFRHCTMTPNGEEIFCLGQEIEPDQPQVNGPLLWDARVRALGITNDNVRVVGVAIQGRTLQYLSLAGLGLTTVPALLADAHALQALDLSDNQLQKLDFSSLPLSGSLHHLDFRGNPSMSIEPNSISPAMSGCFSGPPPELHMGGYANDSAAQPCSVVTVADSTRIDGKTCYRTFCETSWRPKMRCPAAIFGLPPPVDAPFIESRFHCDGVPDCPGAADEASNPCAGAWLVLAANTPKNDDGCRAFDSCIDHFFAFVCAGVLVLKVLSEIQHKSSLCAYLATLYLLYGPNGIYSAETHIGHGQLVPHAYRDLTTGDVGLTLHGATDNVLLSCRYKLQNVDKAVYDARVLFLEEALITARSTTTLAPTTPTSAALLNTTAALPGTLAPASRDRDSITREHIAAAAGTVAAAAIVALVLVVFARRRNRKLTVLEPGIATPARCVQAAEESFNLQYADLLGGQEACTARYRRRLVTRAQLETNGDVLGQGHYGMVLRGVLHKRSFRVRRRQSLLPLMFTPAVNAGAGGISTISNKEGAASEAVTVKMLRDASDDALTHMLVEARLLAAVEHPHIVRLLAVVETPQPVQLAMELCSGGDLRTALKAGALSRAGCDELAAQLDVAHQLATAVEYLHSKLCLHRDLAARNALLAQGRQEDSVARSELIVKLADVGLARAVASEEAYYRSSSGDALPIRWQCPVAIATRRYTAKSDMYSFGVLTWEIFSGGSTPFAELSTAEVIAAVRAGHRLVQPRATTPESVVVLIRACTQLPNVAARPSMATVRATLAELAATHGHVDSRARTEYLADDGAGASHSGLAPMPVWFSNDDEESML